MTEFAVTIESGLKCNNRCAHCNQPAIRAVRGMIDEPLTGEMKERISAARESGAETLALSGGEPTLRADLPALLSHARDCGFSRISITTNGRRLTYPGYAAALLNAGLTGASVSLHGPDAGVHDALTRVPGSFEQTLKGLANLRDAASGMATRFDLSSITVLMPQTVSRLRETLELAGGLGARLHILQPYIAARENIEDSGQYILGIDEIVAGVRGAVRGGLAHGGRIKLYNLPECLFGDLGPVLDTRAYGLRTHREFQDELGRAPGFVTHGQHVRIEACHGCERPCPGLRVEHLPREAMARAIIEDTAGFLSGEAILSSLDLLDSQGVREVLAGIRAIHAGRITALWGGYARTGAADFVAACREARVEEVCLIVHPPVARWPDRHVWLPGNAGKIMEDMALFSGGYLPEPSLFLVLNTLFSADHEMGLDTLDRLLEALRASGGTRLFLVAPEVLNDGAPAVDAAFRARVVEAMPALMGRWRSLGVDPVLLGAPLPPGHAGHETLQDACAALLPSRGWSDKLVHHRFTGLGFGWVMWSDPIWLFPVG